MSRTQVTEAIGPPLDTGGRSNKYRVPCVYVYGDVGGSGKGVELHFELHADGGLKFVMDAATHELLPLNDSATNTPKVGPT